MLQSTSLDAREEIRPTSPPKRPQEVSFWCFLRKNEVFVVQHIAIQPPAYLVDKRCPYFFIIFPSSPQTLIDALLHRKAEAPIAVFYPKLVNGTQVLSGKIINTFFIQPSFFLPTCHLQHDSRRFLIGFSPLFGH